VIDRDTVVQDGYDAELFRMAAVLAAVWQLGSLVQVLVALGSYQRPAVSVAVWLGLLAAAAWLVPKARSGGLTGPQAVAALAVAVAAVAVLGWDREAGKALGTSDWAVFGTGWLLVLVALSRPARVWVPGAILIFATDALFAIRLLGTSPANLGRVVTDGYILMLIPAVFASLRPVMRSQAAIAARRAELESRSVAEQAALAAVREDRRERLALLEAAALPLLRGIAEGSLDPADGEVRARCAGHAAALRRALTDRSQQASGLLAELAPALEAANGRCLPVEIRVVDDPGQPLPEVGRATLTAVDRVLRALPPRPVTLTVLAAADEVELYLPFAAPQHDLPNVADLGRAVPGAARWRAAVEADGAGSGCLEVRWRKTAAG
jgi:hypothetical protein